MGEGRYRAALVITHAGAGSLFEALAAGKAVVAVPNALLMHNHQVPRAAPPLRTSTARTAHFQVALIAAARRLRTRFRQRRGA